MNARILTVLLALPLSLGAVACDDAKKDDAKSDKKDDAESDKKDDAAKPAEKADAAKAAEKAEAKDGAEKKDEGGW